MAAALWAAGLQPWDVTMSDLLAGRASLGAFSGVVFVGGFSYADVLDSAKGWAGTIRRNAGLWRQFTDFYARCAHPYGRYGVPLHGSIAFWQHFSNSLQMLSQEGPIKVKDTYYYCCARLCA
jgi:hypothetical protein